MRHYDEAIQAYQKCCEIEPDDAQVQYNLALVYFQLTRYDDAVEHFKLCTDLDPKHIDAYNSLAFIYNMHQLYPEAIQVCARASMNIPNNYHLCLRHWAFAFYKMGQMGRAVEKIKQAIIHNPDDAEHWIVWGLIMRTIGNYESAKHKFERALKLEPDNQCALFEYKMLMAIMNIDEQISLDQVPEICRLRALENGQMPPVYRK